MKNIAQKEARKHPKINTEMNGKRLTVHEGLLPVLTFMGKLLFRERIQEAVRVIFRGDSGFFTGELLEYLESVSAGYLIKASS